METENLLKTAAEPHLIASASEAITLLADLNSLIKHLRLEVSERELRADLHKNALEQREGVALTRSATEWKISLPYLEFKEKQGLLTDVRALRKNLERHAEMLSSQERFGKRFENKAYLG